MADTFKLAEGFKLVPEGEHVALTIEKISAKPKANPSVIEVVFSHESGATLNNKYDITKDGALVAFSFLARCILGNDVTDFSVSKDMPKLKGKTIDCEVVHTESNGNTYANIKKTNFMIENEELGEEVEDDDL